MFRRSRDTRFEPGQEHRVVPFVSGKFCDNFGKPIMSLADGQVILQKANLRHVLVHADGSEDVVRLRKSLLDSRYKRKQPSHMTTIDRSHQDSAASIEASRTLFRPEVDSVEVSAPPPLPMTDADHTMRVSRPIAQPEAAPPPVPMADGDDRMIDTGLIAQTDVADVADAADVAAAAVVSSAQVDYHRTSPISVTPSRLFADTESAGVLTPVDFNFLAPSVACTPDTREALPLPLPFGGEPATPNRHSSRILNSPGVLTSPAPRVPIRQPDSAAVLGLGGVSSPELRAAPTLLTMAHGADSVPRDDGLLDRDSASRSSMPGTASGW